MLFKGFSISSCSAEQNHFSNLVKGHVCEIILKSGHLTGRRCPLKVFFFFLASADQNHFSNFGRGSLREHSCKIIFR